MFVFSFLFLFQNIGCMYRKNFNGRKKSNQIIHTNLNTHTIIINCIWQQTNQETRNRLSVFLCVITRISWTLRIKKKNKSCSSEHKITIIVVVVFVVTDVYSRWAHANRYLIARLNKLLRNWLFSLIMLSLWILILL